MRKFKLIKTYPGSPVINTVYEEYRIGCFCDPLKTSCEAIRNLDNFPEFWEEIIEKEYEILSLVYKTSKRVLINIKDIKFLVDTGLDDWDIYSVKRLSDGEVFTIGDKIDGVSVLNKIIQAFSIEASNTLYLKHGYGMTWIQDAKKAKQPLFTTEDGVDIFNGDLSYRVSKNSFNIVFHTFVSNNDEGKYFSNREKAKEYILMNKPCLSYKEVCDNFHNNFGKCGHLGILKDLVKQKSNL